MKISCFRRDMSYGWLIIAVVLFIGFLPLQIKAQISINHAPLINSQPTLVVTTDQEYQYKINITDSDGDETVVSLSTAPANMELENDTISWQPTKVGTYNAVIEVSDQNGGYDSQAWQITVNAGAVASLVVTPNDKPTIVNLGNNQQFSVIASDQHGNEISDAEISWTTDEEFSSINQQGVFTAKKGGITFTAAKSGEVETSVGVVVKDIRSTLVTENTASEEPTDAADEETSTAEETTTEEATTIKDTDTEEEETATDEIIMGEETATATEEATTEEEEEGPCTNMAHWLTFLILIIYAVLMVIFYRYEKKHKSGSWWIFPFLLTFIGLIIYYKNFCAQTYLWWPWVLVGIGVIITLYYKGRGKKTSDDSQTELPF